MASKKQLNYICNDFYNNKKFYGFNKYGQTIVIDRLKLVFLVGFIVPVFDYVLMFVIVKFNLNKVYKILFIPENLESFFLYISNIEIKIKDLKYKFYVAFKYPFFNKKRVKWLTV